MKLKPDSLRPSTEAAGLLDRKNGRDMLPPGLPTHHATPTPIVCPPSPILPAAPTTTHPYILKVRAHALGDWPLHLHPALCHTSSLDPPVAKREEARQVRRPVCARQRTRDRAGLRGCSKAVPRNARRSPIAGVPDRPALAPSAPDPHPRRRAGRAGGRRARGEARCSAACVVFRRLGSPVPLHRMEELDL
ncbi:hypothetical protein PTTG_02105, partial [Puccinia triticina 1-1 BBBD Race 1]